METVKVWDLRKLGSNPKPKLVINPYEFSIHSTHMNTATVDHTAHHTHHTHTPGSSGVSASSGGIDHYQSNTSSGHRGGSNSLILGNIIIFFYLFLYSLHQHTFPFLFIFIYLFIFIRSRKP